MCQLKSHTEFRNLIDLTMYFNSEEKCLRYLEQWAWGGKVSCPHCKHEIVYRYKSGKRFFCYGCKYKFTLKMGTIFESTKLPLIKWFMAMYLVANNKKGISSYQLADTIGVSQKTAWFMLTKVRTVFKDMDDSQLEGVVMCDETFVGGKNKNRHIDKKFKYTKGRDFPDKVTVMGLVEMDGNARLFAISKTSKEVLLPIIYKNVKENSSVVTDEWKSYRKLNKNYDHQKVDHSKKEFMNDCGFSTNCVEGLWSIVKRTYNGTYHNMSKKHIQRYMDEIAFRYNTRQYNSEERLNLIMGRIAFTLTQKQIINEKEIPESLIPPPERVRRSYIKSGKHKGVYERFYKNRHGKGSQESNYEA